MTTLDSLRDGLPEYARDLKLNLGSVLSSTGAPGLTQRQIWGVAVASAIAARHVPLASALEALAAEHLAPGELAAVRAAAAIMGMNNVYYRFLHLVGDAQYGQLPARLRMNVMANPGIERVDFELFSLAVSAINGCGTCVAAHERQLREHGLDREAVQSVARIAAVVHAVAGVMQYESAAKAAASMPAGAPSPAAIAASAA